MLRQLHKSAKHFCLKKNGRIYFCTNSSHKGDDEKQESHSDMMRRIIKEETWISRTHLTPEIALHLITPRCALYHEPVNGGIKRRSFTNDPFWAFYWPGGQAVSRYVLDNPAIVANKTVLDVGSGCGASCIAALMRQAKYAVANDIDETAGYATLLNAETNLLIREDLRICCDNLIGQQVPEDVLFLGDVFYDEEFADLMLPWLQQLRAQGKEILIGDPGRHALTAPRLSLLRKLATYELTENSCLENNGFKNVHVWYFK